MSALDLLTQDAETVRQRRSRLVQTLHVPQRVRLGPSLAVALLDGLFGILRECSPLVPDAQAIEVLLCQNGFSAAC
jgi:hypothetical protein